MRSNTYIRVLKTIVYKHILTVLKLELYVHMETLQIDQLPLLAQCNILYEIGFDILVKDPSIVKYILEKDIVCLHTLVDSCIDNRVVLTLVYILSKCNISLCYPGDEEFIKQVIMMVMKDNMSCLKIYIGFFRYYALKLQDKILTCINQLIDKSYPYILPELCDYPHFMDNSDKYPDGIYIAQYYSWWNDRIYLSLRIQKFYDTWIRLFNRFHCQVNWKAIDFKLVICRTSRLFGLLLTDKLLDDLILCNLERIRNVDFYTDGDYYLCEDVFETFHRMGLDISLKMALGNFGEFCRYKKFLMSEAFDVIVVDKKYYRNTDLIKQYVINKDYGAFERVVSMIDFTHADLRKLNGDFVTANGDDGIKTIFKKYCEVV
jgi:hypothetical protein